MSHNHCPISAETSPNAAWQNWVNHPPRIAEKGSRMPPKSLTPEHKKAMAEGRKEGQAVKAYLDALEEQRPRRGRRRTTDSITKRLAAIDKELDGASSLKRLQLRPGTPRSPSRARRDGRRHPRPQRSSSRDSWRSARPIRSARASRTPPGASSACPPTCSSAPASAGHNRATATRRRIADRRVEERPPQAHSVDRAEERIARPLRVGHEPDDVAGLVADPGDVVDAARWGCRRIAARSGPRPAGARASRRRRCSCLRSG